MSTAAIVAGATAVNAVVSNNASKRASRDQQKAIDKSQAFTKENIAQARTDVNQQFPLASQDLLTGFQGALDTYKSFVPQQSQAATQGNINAQGTLLSGLPLAQNAILGGNIDYSKLQTKQVEQPNYSFLDQNINTMFNPQQEQPEQQPQRNINIGDIGDIGRIDNLLGGNKFDFSQYLNRFKR